MPGRAQHVLLPAHHHDGILGEDACDAGIGIRVFAQQHVVAQRDGIAGHLQGLLRNHRCGGGRGGLQILVGLAGADAPHGAVGHKAGLAGHAIAVHIHMVPGLAVHIGLGKCLEQRVFGQRDQNAVILHVRACAQRGLPGGEQVAQVGFRHRRGRGRRHGRGGWGRGVLRGFTRRRGGRRRGRRSRRRRGRCGRKRRGRRRRGRGSLGLRKGRQGGQRSVDAVALRLIVEADERSQYETVSAVHGGLVPSLSAVVDHLRAHPHLGPLVQ